MRRKILVSLVFAYDQGGYGFSNERIMEQVTAKYPNPFMCFSQELVNDRLFYPYTECLTEIATYVCVATDLEAGRSAMMPAELAKWVSSCLIE